MNKTAETSTPILDVIANRWSPRAYDSNYELTQDELNSVLEAGRWAPSANNLQPWRFSVVHRGTEVHTKISEGALSGFNASWIPNASTIVFISVPALKEDGTEYKIAWFDAGLAAQNMMIQAESLGLASHPVSGYNHDAVAAILGLESDRNAVAAIVLGKKASPETLAEGAKERELAPRTRLSLEELVIH